MSTKTSIAAGEGFHFYRELLLAPDNVCLESASPKLHPAKKVSPATQLETVVIPSGVMDEIVISWIMHRKLQGAVGGPVGAELGSPETPGIDSFPGADEQVLATRLICLNEYTADAVFVAPDGERRRRLAPLYRGRSRADKSVLTA